MCVIITDLTSDVNELFRGLSETCKWKNNHFVLLRDCVFSFTFCQKNAHKETKHEWNECCFCSGHFRRAEILIVDRDHIVNVNWSIIHTSRTPKIECGLCHPIGFPFMSSATLPWQRHHAQGSFHTSRKPLAFLRSPDPCKDQVLLITWSSECFRVVHCVATTDGASFTPHQFLR